MKDKTGSAGSEDPHVRGMGNGESGIGTATRNRNPSPSIGMVLAAFAAVYIIWGSTYLAIRFAIQTIPPFLMAGTRFVVAGTILHVASRMRGAEAPTRENWRATAIVGGLLLLGGNGGVVWAEQHVPSGVTALLVATVPLWMVLLEWARSDGRRPTRGVIAGVILGLAGLATLVSPTDLIGRGRVDALGAAVIIAASLSWATGSIYSRRAALPADPFLASGMEMQAGGTFMLLASTVSREWMGGAFDIAMVSKKSLLALAYLLTFGSLVAYTAYTWLLKVSSPARVATYAYVNPVVAVLLGWLLAGEELTTRMLAAAAVIIAAVALITRESGVRSR